MSLLIEYLMPPASLALLALLVLLCWRGPGAAGWSRVALVLIVGLLTLMSMPLVAGPLLASLDPPELATPLAGPLPQAIVILSADVDRTAERGGTDLGAMTLERERAGAALQRRTGLPVLVTGGIVTAPPPVAMMMADSMGKDFNVSVKWIEPRSATTWENARFSARMLKEAGVERVYVVTHAWHMRRSLLAFRRAGLVAFPAPVRTDPWPRGSVRELLPRVSAWTHSYLAMHEWVGYLWYWIRP